MQNISPRKFQGQVLGSNSKHGSHMFNWQSKKDNWRNSYSWKLRDCNRKWFSRVGRLSLPYKSNGCVSFEVLHSLIKGVLGARYSPALGVRQPALQPGNRHTCWDMSEGAWASMALKPKKEVATWYPRAETSAPDRQVSPRPRPFLGTVLPVNCVYVHINLLKHCCLVNATRNGLERK